jgi:flavodoxin
MTRVQGVLILGVAAAIIGIAAFAIMTWKDRTYVPSPTYAPVGQPNPEVAVIYYSRSGHSEAVAREIARALNASIAKINADYALSLSGQRKAISDAGTQTLPAISVEPLRRDSPRRIVLVSPTWMFGPAMPLWTYVEQSDLKGKEVVLVMTGNSRFEQTRIDAFAKRIEARGGHLVKHIFLQRGRVYWQKSRVELLKAVQREMEAIQ